MLYWNVQNHLRVDKVLKCGTETGQIKTSILTIYNQQAFSNMTSLVTCGVLITKSGNWCLVIVCRGQLSPNNLISLYISMNLIPINYFLAPYLTPTLTTITHYSQNIKKKRGKGFKGCFRACDINHIMLILLFFFKEKI